MTSTIALIDRLNKADETWQTYCDGCVETLKSQGNHTPKIEAILRHSINREAATELTTLLERETLLIDLLKDAEISRDEALREVETLKVIVLEEGTW